MFRVQSEGSMKDLHHYFPLVSPQSPSIPPPINPQSSTNLYTPPQLLQDIRQLIQKTRAKAKLYSEVENPQYKKLDNYAMETKRSENYDLPTSPRQQSNSKRPMTASWDSKSAKSSGFYCIEPVHRVSPHHFHKQKTYVVCDGASTTKPSTPMEGLSIITATRQPEVIIQSQTITRPLTPIIASQNPPPSISTPQNRNTIDIERVPKAQYEECRIKRNELEIKFLELQMKYEQMEKYIKEDKGRQIEVRQLRKRNIELMEQLTIHERNQRYLEEEIAWIVAQQIEQYRTKTIKQVGILCHKERSKLRKASSKNRRRNQWGKTSKKD